MKAKKEELAQPCDLCGWPEARPFGDQWICEDCYYGRSSCCPEFGKDDLWTFDADETQEREREEDWAKTSGR